MAFLSLCLAFVAAYITYQVFRSRLYALANVVGALLVFIATLTGHVWVIARYAMTPGSFVHGADEISGTAPFGYLGLAAVWYAYCMGLRWFYWNRRRKAEVKV